MKYIRTKDGNIYEIVEDRQDDMWLVVKEHKPNTYNFKISLRRVFKQADTIEELCDEFVLIKKGKPELFVRNNDEIVKHCAFESFVKFNLPHSNKITDIYGAIWTDKGLFYVAKMNEKGELELLWRTDNANLNTKVIKEKQQINIFILLQVITTAISIISHSKNKRKLKIGV